MFTATSNSSTASPAPSHCDNTSGRASSPSPQIFLETADSTADGINAIA